MPRKLQRPLRLNSALAHGDSGGAMSEREGRGGE